MDEKEIKSCSDCIHYDACYKIEHYGQSPETTALLCELYIDKNDFAPVKHGHWISLDDYFEDAQCSECGDALVIGDCSFNDFCECYKFCPNCGAKMDGGEGK